ncbi:uncharacterized protein LOC135373310 [Ornithodoros turicata]|uniref:uncharacterized protein LOC135373310 n=1 Tax=Ornithodoros turicata TaxID=34597 RepID=UPI00313929D1
MCDPSWKPSKTHGAIYEATSAVCSSPAECNSSDTTYLQTFRAWAVSSNDCLYVQGLFDSGSQRAFIREDVAETLKLPVTGEIEISINAFVSTSSKPVRLKLVQFKLRSQFYNEGIALDAIVVPVICKEIFVAPMPEEHLTHLEVDDIDVADAVIYPGVPEVSGISVLVGADQIWQLLTGEIKRSRANCNLVAMNSKLGWTFLGPSGLRGFVARQSKGMVYVLHSNVGQECFPSAADWKRFWELESIGIVDDLEPPHNNSVLKVFKGSLARNEERYEVRLPWKTTKTPLDPNFEVAKTRVKRLVCRLSENEELHQKYDRAIRSYIHDGHAEQVPMRSAECPAMTSERIYYMPHREVRKEESSSTKIRIVFDASSHARACTH